MIRFILEVQERRMGILLAGWRREADEVHKDIVRLTDRVARNVARAHVARADMFIKFSMCGTWQALSS